MEERERIRELRRVLHLTGVQMGEALGMTKNSICQMERGTSGITDRTRTQICQTYHVRYQWLRYGEGEIFEPPLVKSMVEELQEKYHLTESGAKLVEQVTKLPEPLQDAMIDVIFRIARGMVKDHPELKINLDSIVSPAQNLSEADAMQMVHEQYEQEKEAAAGSSPAQEAVS